MLLTGGNLLTRRQRRIFGLSLSRSLSFSLSTTLHDLGGGRAEDDDVFEGSKGDGGGGFDNVAVAVAVRICAVQAGGEEDRWPIRLQRLPSIQHCHARPIEQQPIFILKKTLKRLIYNICFNQTKKVICCRKYLGTLCAAREPRRPPPPLDRRLFLRMLCSLCSCCYHHRRRRRRCLFLCGGDGGLLVLRRGRVVVGGGGELRTADG